MNSKKIFNHLAAEIDDEPFLLGSSDIGNLSYQIPVIASNG